MDKIQHKDKELDYLTRSLLHHPSPYIIYELDGSIAWANMAAIYIFELDQLNPPVNPPLNFCHFFISFSEHFI